jgi:hypothetical protein
MYEVSDSGKHFSLWIRFKKNIREYYPISMRRFLSEINLSVSCYGDEKSLAII